MLTRMHNTEAWLAASPSSRRSNSRSVFYGQARTFVRTSCPSEVISDRTSDDLRLTEECHSVCGLTWHA